MFKKKKRMDNVEKLDSTYVKEQEAYLARKRREKKLLKRRLIAFGLLFLLVAGTLSVYYVQQQAIHEDKKAEQEQLQAELKTAKDEQERLEREVELLNDTDYLLQIARKDYFFSREGEVIFNLPEDSEEGEPSY
ncbi:FtsB family cell division protein [Alkalibacillus salilacus]|uniref:Cell division protein DivIC n=1 Tax=Alkalibacillus salilacus TaxID=284582 RepID=A0ABT9VCC0_9BACI|nr:septum formation initiator family protein [Alkalibacillus salilacus]MDQ0158460.1 cell division protein DivIC [Alkalibacillus salilacus]